MGPRKVTFAISWMKNGGLIPWNAIAICDMFKTSWQTVENHPISSRDQSRLDQFGKTVSWNIHRIRVDREEGIWKGDVVVADIEEL